MTDIFTSSLSLIAGVAQSERACAKERTDNKVYSFPVEIK